MDTLSKLEILAEAAKYDAACTSSGVTRGAVAGRVGCASAAGCCHSFTPDGRCITLLKVLMSNACSFDCAYCVNRSSASCQRATFTPRELAELTLDFYKRNYIEGLFLSSGVLGTPDATTERMIECLRILRSELRFNGYIHAKVIPGTSSELVHQLGLFADRLSCNLELPSADSLERLCPNKTKKAVLAPMSQIARTRDEEEQALLISEGRDQKLIGSKGDESRKGQARTPRERLKGTSPGNVPLPLIQNANKLTLTRGSKVRANRRAFAPAGQSTQLIIGATPEDDHHILTLSKSLYESFGLKRVFFSAYIPMIDDAGLPSPETPVPLRREHRLYQADWLMRYYGFDASELVAPDKPWLDLDLDPKLAWALTHQAQFPLEVMDATLEQLLRVPGIGPVGARRIVATRKNKRLTWDGLKTLRITLKRARPFLTCCGTRAAGVVLDEELIRREVAADAAKSAYNKARRAHEGIQLTLF